MEHLQVQVCYIALVGPDTEVAAAHFLNDPDFVNRGIKTFSITQN